MGDKKVRGSQAGCGEESLEKETFRTLELNRVLWLKMRLESRKGSGHPEPYKHGECLSFILE